MDDGIGIASIIAGVRVGGWKTDLLLIRKIDDSCNCSDGISGERQSLGGSLQSWKPAKLEACKARSLQSWKPAKLEACKAQMVF
jgi:hypothetical protein